MSDGNLNIAFGRRISTHRRIPKSLLKKPEITNPTIKQFMEDFQEQLQEQIQEKFQESLAKMVEKLCS